MVNGSLFRDSSKLESIFTRVDGTYVSSGLTPSLMCQDASSDKDTNGQSLRPHTSLDNLPKPINRSESSQGAGDTGLCLLFARSSGAYPS